jgi:hypothetical protein
VKKFLYILGLMITFSETSFASEDFQEDVSSTLRFKTFTTQLIVEFDSAQQQTPTAWINEQLYGMGTELLLEIRNGCYQKKKELEECINTLKTHHTKVSSKKSDSKRKSSSSEKKKFQENPDTNMISVQGLLPIQGLLGAYEYIITLINIKLSTPTLQDLLPVEEYKDFAASLQAQSTLATEEELKGWIHQTVPTLNRENLVKALEACVSKRIALRETLQKLHSHELNTDKVQSLFEAYTLAIDLIKEKYRSL